MILWLTFLLTASADVKLPPDAELRQVAKSPAWLRLVHYLPSGSGYKSELDGSGFFFASDGRTNPLAELKASIAAFHTLTPTGVLKLAPRCSFPERFRFISEKFPQDFPQADCAKFKEFMDMFNGARGVSLVFSSAYPSNPASMFGHTFLKIRSQRTNDLLNKGVNFAAYTGNNLNMALLIYQGVFGGYRGLWSAEPYYKKVNEYVNAESRDLWEFDLSLSEAETQRLLAHLFELEVNSYFHYYFFDENCSYQILRALEAIRLEWNLSDHRIYVIPGETIKRINETPGAVTEVHFRPSLYHQLENRYDSLSKKEQKSFHRLMKGDVAAEATPEVLDAALLAHLFKRAKKKMEWSPVDQAAENKILALRAVNSSPAKPLADLPRLFQARPGLGHDPFSWHFSGGYLDAPGRPAGGFGRLRWRSSYHDLLAPDIGFSPFTEIEFPSFEVKWYDSHLLLSEVRFLNITSIFPMREFSAQKSWRVKVALEEDRTSECDQCLLQTAELGAGGALGGDKDRYYLLALGRGEAQRDLRLGYRLRGGYELGWVGQFGARYKTRVLQRTFWSVPRKDESLRTYEFGWEHGFSVNRNHEIRQISSLLYEDRLRSAAWSEFQLQWVYYFR